VLDEDVVVSVVVVASLAEGTAPFSPGFSSANGRAGANQELAFDLALATGPPMACLV